MSDYILADEIQGNNADWDSVQQAIINKGVDVPELTPTSEYANKIEQIQSGGDDSEEWRPNPKWVTMPPMPPEGEQKIYCIVMIRREYPYYSVRATTVFGQYGVDWGAGAATLHDGATTAEYTYDYDGIESEVTDLGYKTVLVTITPVVSNALRNINFNYAHSADIRTGVKSNALLYVSGRVPNITSFVFGVSSTTAPFARSSFLEWVNFLDQDSIMTYQQTFYGCTSLRGTSPLSIAEITTYAQTFYGCISMTQPPTMNMSDATSLANMFDQCTSLRIFPATNDTRKVTNFLNTFSSCTLLEIVENLNCLSAQALTFPGCVNLKVLRLTMGSVTGTLSIANTALNTDALDLLGEDLYDRTGLSPGTLTITGCLGASAWSAESRARVTIKNWTIVG